MELKIKRSSHWTYVFAEDNGKDVSHLGYGDARLQVGRAASMRMATIGGVATDKNHRRQGLAQKVFARALEEMRRERFPTVGLYTSRSIVAHRLYRRFGFVDVWRQQPLIKLLNHPLRVQRVFASLVRQTPELQNRRLHLSLKLDPPAPINLRIEGNEVTILSRVPKKVDLFLKMSDMTFMQLCEGEFGLEQAHLAKLVYFSGEATVFELLKRIITGHANPIHEE